MLLERLETCIKRSKSAFSDLMLMRHFTSVCIFHIYFDFGTENLHKTLLHLCHDQAIKQSVKNGLQQAEFLLNTISFDGFKFCDLITNAR
jgi:hypothetical protein